MASMSKEELQSQGDQAFNLVLIEYVGDADDLDDVDDDLPFGQDEPAPVKEADDKADLPV